jgi:5'-3' exonuclease
MKALLDGDILVYRVGFGAQEESEGIAQARMDESIEKILDAVKATEYEVFLTSGDKSNFRIPIFPEYKANRKAPKPVHYDMLREYLVTEHQANMVHGQEADDAMGIEQYRMRDDLALEFGIFRQINYPEYGLKETVICSIDKDMDQIPGLHFNFVKGLLYKVTPQEGLYKFYLQLLMGDATDNIKGIPGIGPKKAAGMLSLAKTEEDMYSAVVAAYKAVYPENYMDLIRCYGQLLKIRTKEDELWLPLPERQNPNTALGLSVL